MAKVSSATCVARENGMRKALLVGILAASRQSLDCVSDLGLDTNALKFLPALSIQ
jgi:hypothetical protein